MAVLVYSELSSLFLDRLQANVSTDAPISAAEIARFLNQALAEMWEISGGGVKTVASATAWTNANLATGVVTGILTDIKEVLTVWASQTPGSVGVSTDDNRLDPAELSYIQFRRKSFLTGTHSRPQIYSITRLATATPASVGLHRLDYWPSVTGFYLPTEYIPQFTPIDSATVTTPDLNDLESRDLPLLAALSAAPLLGRAELAPGIAADISSKTGLIVLRKRQAMLSGDQDREAAA